MDRRSSCRSSLLAVARPLTHREPGATDLAEQRAGDRGLEDEVHSQVAKQRSPWPTAGQRALFFFRQDRAYEPRLLYPGSRRPRSWPDLRSRTGRPGARRAGPRARSRVSPRASCPRGWRASNSSSSATWSTERLPGAVLLLARRGQVGILKAFGLADAESRRPMTTDSLFRMASATKIVTSVGLLTLYEEGRVGLGDAVGDHLPELRALSVRQADGSVKPATEAAHDSRPPAPHHGLRLRRRSAAAGGLPGGRPDAEGPRRRLDARSHAGAVDRPARDGAADERTGHAIRVRLRHRHRGRCNRARERTGARRLPRRPGCSARCG